MAWQPKRLAKPPAIHALQIVVFAKGEGSLFGLQVAVAGQLGVVSPAFWMGRAKCACRAALKAVHHWALMVVTGVLS